MKANVLFAVFKRNFVSYFSNPTGYVFICVFVALSAIAAFWTPEFFNANLANLNQLNYWFPFIMLVFVPAITMSIWAEERRQGTDELLLTIPAGDLEIVLGKYLAAVAIYTVSLLFSLVCNFFVLKEISFHLGTAVFTTGLGDPDVGLFLGTYFGYWLVGLTMLAVAMVASFLTSNLTVAFILGALLNVPLVFLVNADVILPGSWAAALQPWSISGQSRDFGRGVIGLSSIFYFGMIVATMLYIAMVLIGRRHWFVGRERSAMFGHYALRALALLAIALGGTAFFMRHDVRADVTVERLSTLAPQTTALLAKLDPKTPVRIQAFISPDVPQAFVPTELNLRTALRELEARSGGKLQVEIHETRPLSEEAQIAEQRYGIQPREVAAQNEGRWTRNQIFMHVVVTCGTRKVGPVFLDRGVPVEYELVRSIATAAEPQRKRIGILTTDAPLYGGFDFQRGASPNWPFIDELEKQYEVVRIDPAKPIVDNIDALVAVQPSSLGPEEMERFTAAVRSGIPTAIFEDPLPYLAGNIPGTSAPKRQQNQMMMMQQGAAPKGDIGKLWSFLGVDFVGNLIVWQDYNPYPKVEEFPAEFVFIQEPVGKLNQQDPITSGLQQLLFPFPGSVRPLNLSTMQFEPLVRTADRITGTIRYSDIMKTSMFGQEDIDPARMTKAEPTGESYILAAAIHGTLPAAETTDHKEGKEGKSAEAQANGDKAAAAKSTDAKAADAKAAEAKAKDAKADAPAPPKRSAVRVVLVADLDMLTPAFFKLREQGDIPEAGIHFDFDNVNFVLNIVDSLAGEDRFMDLRKRRPRHRTLTQIEARTEEAKKKSLDERQKLSKGLDEAEQREQEALRKEIDALQKDRRANTMEVIQRAALAQQRGEMRMQAKLETLRQQRDRELRRINAELDQERERIRSGYKFWAVVLPPIPPLLIAGVVFYLRRKREDEGVARARLR